jgi:hypothetical protein
LDETSAKRAGEALGGVHFWRVANEESVEFESASLQPTRGRVVDSGVTALLPVSVVLVSLAFRIGSRWRW